MQEHIEALRREILRTASLQAPTPQNLPHLGNRPVFLMAPMSYAGMQHGQRIANGAGQVIAAVDDITPHDRIHGAPRWSSAEFLARARQYPDAVCIDFACSPGGRRFVEQLCRTAGLERLAAAPPDVPLIAGFEDCPLFFMSPQNPLAAMHAPGVAMHSGKVVATVDDGTSPLGQIDGVPRWSSQQFLAQAQQYPGALAIDFSADVQEGGKVRALCEQAGIELVDMCRATAHCGQHAVYEPARIYQRKTLARLDDFLRLADRLEDDFSVFTLYSNLLFRLTYEREHLLPAWATPANEYFSACGDASTFQLGTQEHFCDCGAYQGPIVQKFLAHTRHRYASITAFEPDPINFAQLQSLASPWTPNFRAINKAVSNTVEELRFKQTGTMSSHATPDGDIAVPTARLDDEVDKITLLKMDIEGFEPKALAGAAHLIHTQRPRIAACVYHYALDLLDVIDQIDQCADGYHYRLRQHSHTYYYDLVLYASPISGSGPVPWAA